VTRTRRMDAITEDVAAAPVARERATTVEPQRRPRPRQDMKWRDRYQAALFVLLVLLIVNVLAFDFLYVRHLRSHG
jgi:hypothetical protein